MQSCRTCGGRGIKVTMRQLGPGMVQQMQSVCPECRGEGQLMLLSHSCVLLKINHICSRICEFLLFYSRLIFSRTDDWQ